MVTYLWEVLEGCEADDLAIAVKHGQREVGTLDEFENARVRVDAVEYVVFADFDEAHN